MGDEVGIPNDWEEALKRQQRERRLEMAKQLLPEIIGRTSLEKRILTLFIAKGGRWSCDEICDALKIDRGTKVDSRIRALRRSPMKWPFTKAHKPDPDGVYRYELEGWR